MPLMSQNKTLNTILEAVYRMAARKRKANQERPEGEKYAELQRIRLGSRLPAYLPMRINNELVEILRTFKGESIRHRYPSVHHSNAFPNSIGGYSRGKGRYSQIIIGRLADYQPTCV